VRTQFDLVIIGSGAGGAPIANRLAKQGKSVLVLEKGPLLRPNYQEPSNRSPFRRDEVISDGPEKILKIPTVANNGVSYYSSHVEPDLNDEPHVYRDPDDLDRATIEGYTAQVVGGGTQLYGGVSLRFTPTDLTLKTFNDSRKDIPDDVRREARDWPVPYSVMEKYYAVAEDLVGINGTVANQQKPFTSGDHYQPPLSPNPISQFAKAGMGALGKQLGSNILPYRTPLAVITRDHPSSYRKVPRDPESAKTSYVNRYGDPLGLKSSTWVSLLYPIIKEGHDFEIRPNCIATRLSSDGSRINRVYYLDPGGIERYVEGRLVIVACSAIESVRLLMLSGEESADFKQRINGNGLLGRYFLTHSFGGARALVPGRYDKSKALDADYATDCCATEDFIRANGLWAGGAIYNNTSDQALPLSMFRTLASTDLDSLWKGFMGGGYRMPDGSTRDLRGQGFVDYLDLEFGRGLSVSFMANQVPQRDNRIELHPVVNDKWGRRVAYVIKNWHEQDRKLMDIYANQCGDILRLGAGSDPNFFFEGQGGIYSGETALARMANHILGGARFGTDRNDSVLDVNCRVWNFDNLYVTDGAFMPTSGGANPTLTIQANSFRVAEHLLTRI
jgi:choline dehydrogenase-like flavoprotein